MSCAQSPVFGLSSALIQMSASINWKTSTTTAAAKPTPARILTRPANASSSSSSTTWNVAACDEVGNEVPRGLVGACSWTVALGRVGTPPPGRRALVGEEEDVARRIVGAGEAVGLPAERNGIVGAGAVGEGGALGTGGRTGGAMGTVAEGTEGGASEALSVTRTVSFFRGTLDVCLDGVGGKLSFSVMCVGSLNA